MKKTADQAQMTMVDVKLKAIQDAVNGHITKMNNLLKQPQPNIQAILTDLNANVAAMNKVIVDKTREMKSMILAPPPVTTTTPPAPAPAAADDQIIPGGLGADLKSEDVDQKQLEMGIKVELEHTGDKDMAQEIALDHLAEDPKYYTNLKKVHQDSRDSHLGPRGKKQNPELPDFWRRNFDYGESPYMHMDEIKVITDRPISKRKRKKKK